MFFVSLLVAIGLMAEASDMCTNRQKEKIGPCFDGQKMGVGKLEWVDLDLSGSLFLSANLIGTTFKRVLGHDVSFKQSRFNQVKMKQVDFSRADFRGVQAFRWDLSNVKFDRVNFSGARIERSLWRGVQLKDSQFNATYIADSIFENCSYPKGLFAKAILINVHFRHCKEEGP